MTAIFRLVTMPSLQAHGSHLSSLVLLPFRLPVFYSRPLGIRIGGWAVSSLPPAAEARLEQRAEQAKHAAARRLHDAGGSGQVDHRVDTSSRLASTTLEYVSPMCVSAPSVVSGTIAN